MGTPPQGEPIQQARRADLTHRVHGSFAETQPLQAAWNALAREHGDLLSSYEWCDTWWRHFGTGRQLEIHTLHAEDRLVGVLPLFHETLAAAAGLRVVRLVGCDYTIDAAGLAIQPEYVEPFCQRVLRNLGKRGRWDIVQLGPLRSYATVTEAIAAAAVDDPSVQTVIIGRQDNWQTLFDLPATYEEYFKSLPGDERRDTSRRERKLREGRDVQIVPVDNPQEVPAAMDALIQLHQRIWTGRGMAGQFGEFDDVEQFHREMADCLVGTGQLAMVIVRVDGEIVGAGYGYHFGRRTHTMFRGYRNDEPWRSYALGRLVHCGQVRQAIGRGSTQIEDGRGVFDYKLRLGGRLYGERSLLIVRRGWINRLRLWAGLRTAYLVHVLYARIWLDMIATRLRRRPPAYHFYVRSHFLAKMFGRTRFGLFGGTALQEAGGAPPPGSPPAS